MRRTVLWLVGVVLLLAGCREAEVTVVATRDMGPLETTDAIKARDGGYSMRFRDHSVWAYGDTILAFAGVDDSSWRNSTGQWLPDLADAATMFEGESQMSVHYSEHLGRYLAVYAVDFGERVVLRTAEALDGPWSDELSAFSTLVPLVDDAFNYCGMAHPEYAVDGGRLEYISYYRTTGDWNGEIRVVEVELDAP